MSHYIIRKEHGNMNNIGSENSQTHTPFIHLWFDFPKTTTSPPPPPT